MAWRVVQLSMVGSLRWSTCHHCPSLCGSALRRSSSFSASRFLGPPWILTFLTSLSLTRFALGLPIIGWCGGRCRSLIASSFWGFFIVFHIQFQNLKAGTLFPLFLKGIGRGPGRPGKSFCSFFCFLLLGSFSLLIFDSLVWFSEWFRCSEDLCEGIFLWQDKKWWVLDRKTEFLFVIRRKYRWTNNILVLNFSSEEAFYLYCDQHYWAEFPRRGFLVLKVR